MFYGLQLKETWHPGKKTGWGVEMRCPHCQVAFRTSWERQHFASDADGRWTLSWTTCPECNRITVYLELAREERKIPDPQMVRPKGTNRPPCPPQVPKELAQDYTEACLVLQPQGQCRIEQKVSPAPASRVCRSQASGP